MHHPRHRQPPTVAPTYANTPPPRSGAACLAAGTSDGQTGQFARNQRFRFSGRNQRAIRQVLYDKVN